MFVHLRDLGTGIRRANLVTVGVSLQDARYRDPIRVQQLFMLRRIRSISSGPRGPAVLPLVCRTAAC